MGIRSFFQKIFNTDNSNNNASRGTKAQFLSGNSSNNPYTGDLYANHLVRSIVNKIATYCSMVKFEHVRGEGKNFEKLKSSRINKLLTIKPNDLLMTPADLQYKFFTDLFLKNNAYEWIRRDSDGIPVALLPVVARQVEMLEINGFLFYRFHFASGDKLTIHSDDIIHNRRFYYQNDWFGDSNEPLRDSVGMVDDMNKSVQSGLKNGANLKGILKHTNTINPEDLDEHQRIFQENYLNASNSGGIGMIDAKFDFIPTNFNSKITDAEQMKEIRDYVYRYFQVNDEIMLSKYSSDVWQAFHESVIAPELNKYEQAASLHLFTDRELGVTNRIQSSVNKISFMSAQQKLEMTKLSLDGALYNRNEMREWFGDGPIPGGDVYQYSKNFTEQTKTNDQKEEGDATGNTNTTTDQTDPADDIQE